MKESRCTFVTLFVYIFMYTCTFKKKTPVQNDYQSTSWKDKFRNKYHIHHRTLEEYNTGMIGLSGCGDGNGTMWRCEG